MNNNLDHLIPTQIQDLLNCKHIEFRLVLCGSAAQGRWPQVQVSVDSRVLYKGAVQESFDQTFCLTGTAEQTSCVLLIEYFDKTDKDTVVDQQGVIVENQHVTIQQLFVNGVDIVADGLIHQGFGEYTMHLGEDKRRYFLEHGHPVGPSTVLNMFENGIWRLKFELPILSFLTRRQQAHTELWESTDISALLEEVYERVLICQQLEKQIKEE